MSRGRSSNSRRLEILFGRRRADLVLDEQTHLQWQGKAKNTGLGAECTACLFPRGRHSLAVCKAGTRSG